jgi:hypothetical protein
MKNSDLHKSLPALQIEINKAPNGRLRSLKIRVSAALLVILCGATSGEWTRSTLAGKSALRLILAWMAKHGT